MEESTLNTTLKMIEHLETIEKELKEQDINYEKLKKLMEEVNGFSRPDNRKDSKL